MMTSGHEIAMGLRSAYLLMHRQTNAFLSRYGMTADQFVLLALLAEEDGVTQQELSQRASSDPNTIRAMLVLMEEKGFVKRAQHPTDGRALMVTLTGKGRQIYAKLSSAVEPLQDFLSGPFEAEESEKLAGFLNKISDAMQEWESEHRTQ